jgi:hypothetical protein
MTLVNIFAFQKSIEREETYQATNLTCPLEVIEKSCLEIAFAMDVSIIRL